MDDLTLLIVSIVASIYLPFVIYLISKLFAIKEYREKQNKAMFDWVTSTLFDQVYEPLKEFSEEIPTVINPYNEDWETVDEDYRRDVLLFSTAKFLHYAFKNREKVGGDNSSPSTIGAMNILRNFSEIFVWN
jgi:hypothetical protein